MKREFLLTVLCVCVSLCMQAQNETNYFRLSSDIASQDYATLHECLDAMKGTNALPRTGNWYQIDFLGDWTEDGNKDVTLEENGYACGVNISGESGLNMVRVNGAGHQISSNHKDNPTRMQSLSIVIRVPNGGTLEVYDLTINDNICFKPMEGKKATSPKTNLYIHDCSITGKYISGDVPFLTATFERCHFTNGGSCLIWPKINSIGYMDDLSIYPYSIILKDNYALTTGLVNTASHNYRQVDKWFTRVEVNIVAVGNTVEIPKGTNGSICLIQNTDSFGNVDIHDNTIVGDFVPNPNQAQCILMQYCHGDHFYFKNDIDGEASSIYRNTYMATPTATISVYDNYMQCNLSPFVIGGDYHNFTVKKYDELTDWQKSWYRIGMIANNLEAHHFATITSGHDKLCHVCPVCGWAIVTANHDGCVTQSGTDINHVVTTIPHAWTDNTEVINDYEINGVSVPYGCTATFQFHTDADGKAKNGEKRVVGASFLGNAMTVAQLASGFTWTNNTILSECPVFNVVPKVKLIVSPIGYSTFSSDEHVTFIDAENVGKFIAYRATDYIGGVSSKLYFTNTPALPSVEGALVKGTPGTYWLSILDTAPVVSGINAMRKGGVVVTPDLDNFVLASSSSHPLGFYRVAKDTPLPSGNAYLNLSAFQLGATTSLTRMLTLQFNDSPTGIQFPILNQIGNTHNSGRFFTPSGMMIGTDYRGMQIGNNIKIIGGQ